MLYISLIFLIFAIALSICIFFINKKTKEKIQEIYNILDEIPHYIFIHDDSNIYYTNIKTKTHFKNIVESEMIKEILNKKTLFYKNKLKRFGNKIYSVFSSPIEFNRKKLILTVFNDITLKLEKERKIEQLGEIEFILKKLFVLTYDENFNLKGAMEIIYNYLRKIHLIDLFAYADLIDNNNAKVILYYENELYTYTKKRKEKSIMWYFIDNNLEKLYISDISKFKISGYDVSFEKVLSKKFTSYIFPYHNNCKIKGIFSFSKKGENAYTDEEKRLIELIAQQIDFIIRYQNILGEYKKKKEFFETLVNKDILTNLYSRYFFNDWIINHIEYLRRSNKKSIIVMIDIDKFKKINDTYGHIKGDEVLKFVAKIILDNIRKMDIAVRFGGDEFLIIFPEASIEIIKEKMKELSKKISNNSFDFDISISYGISELYTDNYIESLKIADSEMYKMKEKLK